MILIVNHLGTGAVRGLGASARAWRWWLVVAFQLGICVVIGLLEHYAATPPPTPSAEAHPLDALIRRTAQEHMPPGWDWRLLKAMVAQESGFDPEARSPGGAVGLTQLLPATARAMGLSRGAFFDPAANLAAGTRYLRRMYDRFHAVPDVPPHWRRTRLAIAAYNAGPARARRAVDAADSAAWPSVAPGLPDSTVHHVETIVEGFYPRFAATPDPALGPALQPPSPDRRWRGPTFAFTGWRSRLRLWDHHGFHRRSPSP
ncbi:MAG: transglycosylase SLT domain-containing protein [Planctomycetota bacterium]